MLAALLATAALAAPFGEAAPTTVNGESSSCLQPTGRPGELFTMTRKGVRFLDAGRDGVTAGATIDLTGYCAAAALNPGGAGVVACCVQRRPPVAVFRDPGGSWSEPAEIGPDDGHLVTDIAAAASLRGAVVAWIEYATGGREGRVKAVRRAPGGTFGEVESLGSAPTETGRLALRMTADGEALVLWTTPPAQARSEIMVAAAPAGAPFAATRLAEVSRHARPSLAVAPDGHALVAFDDGKAVQVAERAPGAAFAAPTRVAALKDPLAARTQAELGADGRALLAWSGVATGGVHLVTRAPGAGFSSPATLAAGDPKLSFDVFLNEQFGGFGNWDWGGAELSTTLAPDGRAAVAWNDPRKGTRTANLSVTALDGSPPATYTSGGLSSVDAPRALLLADGTPALAFAGHLPRTGFRVRLAAEGASTPEPALPRVRLRRPTSTTLAGESPELRLPVECSGPCELRADLGGELYGSTSASLERAGRTTLDFPLVDDRVHRNRRGEVRVRVRYAAPLGTRTRTTTLRFTVGRTGLHPPRPAPRVVGLRAVRHGTSIRVTWRTTRSINGGLGAAVVGRATRSPFEDPISYADTSKGGRVFAVTLRHAARVKFVTLYSYEAVAERPVLRVR